jgi:hypothetical protein
MREGVRLPRPSVRGSQGHRVGGSIVASGGVGFSLRMAKGFNTLDSMVSTGGVCPQQKARTGCITNRGADANS